jgi:formate hydrogenlyase subunit 3/multisubunit Na+/H+ antiporter MnhD subunit
MGCEIPAKPTWLSTSGGNALGLCPISVNYDGLSAVFPIAFGVSAAAASLSVVGVSDRSRPEGAAFLLFLASIVLVLGANTAFSFPLAREAMALLSASAGS